MPKISIVSPVFKEENIKNILHFHGGNLLIKGLSFSQVELFRQILQLIKNPNQ